MSVGNLLIFQRDKSDLSWSLYIALKYFIKSFGKIKTVVTLVFEPLGQTKGSLFLSSLVCCHCDINRVTDKKQGNFCLKSYIYNMNFLPDYDFFPFCFFLVLISKTSCNQGTSKCKKSVAP